LKNHSILHRIPSKNVKNRNFLNLLSTPSPPSGGQYGGQPQVILDWQYFLIKFEGGIYFFPLDNSTKTSASEYFKSFTPRKRKWSDSLDDDPGSEISQFSECVSRQYGTSRRAKTSEPHDRLANPIRNIPGPDQDQESNDEEQKSTTAAPSK